MFGLAIGFIIEMLLVFEELLDEPAFADSASPFDDDQGMVLAEFGIQQGHLLLSAHEVHDKGTDYGYIKCGLTES